MRILMLMPRVCWPPQTGLMLRNYYLARELARAAQVTCLSFSDDQTSVDEAARRELPPPPEEWCEEVITVKRDSAYTPGKIVRGAIGRTPLPALNYTTDAMRDALKRVLGARPFDVVQVETSTLAEYLPVIKAARGARPPLAVCDWHNIDSELMRRYSEQAKHPARKLYARLTARRMTAFERKVMRSFDGHVAVSERDAAGLRALADGVPLTVIENGVDVDFYADDKLARAHDVWRNGRGNEQDVGRQNGRNVGRNESGDDVALSSASSPSTQQQRQRRRVVFVGSMDYHANVDAVVHFAEEMWPEIQRRSPALVFTVVGRNPAPEVQRLASREGIEVTGTVADVRPYYYEAAAQIVPLRVGGGSRLKILEAMAAGVPVISTTLGAEGLHVTDAVNIALADDAQAMSRALVELSEDETRRAELIRAARELVRRQYDWSALGAQLYRAHESLLRTAAR